MQTQISDNIFFLYVFFFFLLRITLTVFLIPFLHCTQGSIHHHSLSPFPSLPYFQDWKTNKHMVTIDRKAIKLVVYLASN